MPSVTRGKRGPRTVRRHENRRRLHAAAETLLAEHPYTAISVEQLVREAGVSRSTFYAVFADKGELLREMSAELIDGLFTTAQAWWSLPPDARRGDVHAAMSAIADRFVVHRRVWVALAETAAYDETAGAHYRRLLQETIGRVEEHIRAGQRDGSVHAELDAARTAAWLTAMTERGLSLFVGPATADEAERLVRALTDVVWNALYAWAPTRAGAPA